MPAPALLPPNDLPYVGQPALRALAAANIDSLAQLSRFSQAEIARLHGIGPNALSKLNQALTEHGLSFAAKD